MKLLLALTLVLAQITTQLIQPTAAPGGGASFSEDFNDNVNNWIQVDPLGSWDETAQELVMGTTSGAVGMSMVTYSLDETTPEETDTYSQWACVELDTLSGSVYHGLGFCMCEDYTCTPKYVITDGTTIYVGEADAFGNPIDTGNPTGQSGCSALTTGDYLCAKYTSSGATATATYYRLTTPPTGVGDLTSSCANDSGMTITACTGKGIGLSAYINVGSTADQLDNFSGGDQ